jgi:hypothetical protein
MKRKRFFLTKMLKNSNKTGKIFLLLAAVTVCFCMIGEAMAQTVDSGTTGDCTWTLTGTSGNYTLTINGSGAMEDYTPVAAWYKYRTSIKTVIIEDGVTRIGNEAFSRCTALTSVTIPESVTNIGNYAFFSCGLTSVIIGNNVKSIGQQSFSSCRNLLQITVPESVESIGKWAFSTCENLASVTIGNGVKSIGDGAFSHCESLTSVSIPDGVTDIGESTFEACSSLISITIPESVTGIGNSAFYWCSSLASITIPGSVKSIGDRAFYDCSSLASIAIPQGVESIGDRVFGACGSLAAIDVHENNAAYASENGVLFNREKTALIRYPAGKTEANYAIPNSVSGIEDGAFSSCKNLTSITIPNSVESIGEQAFSGCSDLSSLTIGSSVADIGAEAFSACSSLASVTNLNPVPQVIDLYTFDFVSAFNATLYVPAESVESYKLSVWRGFGTITAYTPSAIHAPAIANAIRVYPNPVSESFRIEGLIVPTQITVTDINGKALLQQIIKGEENISVGHLPQGIYLIRVNGETTKIIKTF